MSGIKGWPSNEKEDRLSNEFVTVQPFGPRQYGLNTVSKQHFQVGTDAVEAGSTTSVINATGHAAQKGDIVKLTSGALAITEASVYEVDTNTITLAETLSAAPSATDAFAILRPISPIISSTGASSGVTSFTLDGSNQEVVKDTGTPANNRPLPVELVGTDGVVEINSANLNLEVQLEHTGANADSVQIGDGSDVLGINPDESIGVAGSGDAKLQQGAGAESAETLRTTPATDSEHLLNTRHETATTPLAARLTNGAAFADFGAGVVGANTVRTTPATDSPHLLDTRHEAVGTPLSVRLGNGTGFLDTGLGVVTANTLANVPQSDAEHLLSTRHEDLTTPLAVRVSNGAGGQQFGGGVVNALTIRTTPATDSEHLLATRHETVTTPLAFRQSDGTNFASVKTIDGNQQEITGTNYTPLIGAMLYGHSGAGHKEISITSGGDLPVVTGEQNSVWQAYNDYTGTPVTTVAYVEIIASTVGLAKKLHIFDSSGEAMILATGGAGSEVDRIYVPPGGDVYTLSIANGTRIALKALTANATTGYILISTFGDN